MNGTVVAILVSDLHLQLEVPVARLELDWKAKMCEPYARLNKLARQLKVPVVCAGDVFDRWKAPPELINFALDVLPQMYAIPGQHDLPFHNYEDVHRSAYHTLVKAGKIIDLPPGIAFPVPTPAGAPDLNLYGFPWDHDVQPGKVEGNTLNLAVIHAYIWTAGTGHKDAAVDAKLPAWKERLRGFHAAVFGDNHVPFTGRVGHCSVFNHGAFILRKSDERHLKPSFGLLMDDGTIQFHPNEGKSDQWLPEKEAAKKEDEEVDFGAMVTELQALGATGLDFEALVRAYLEHHSIPPKVRKVIIRLMDMTAATQ